MKSKWLIGSGDYADIAEAAWRALSPNGNVIRIQPTQNANFDFDLDFFEGLNPVDGEVFIAFDERFGNFKRMELMSIAMERGLKIASIVSPTACIPPGFKPSPNVFVGDLAVVGVGSRVDFNTVIHAGVIIGSNTRVGSSCWLEMGTRVGSGAKIGSHCTLRMGSSVGANVKIGHGCHLGWSKVFNEDVPELTTYDNRFEEPVRIYRG